MFFGEQVTFTSPVYVIRSRKTFPTTTQKAVQLKAFFLVDLFERAANG